MPKEYSQVHREGCEYGRTLSHRIENLEQVSKEQEKRAQELEARMRNVETNIAKQSGKYIIIGMTLASAIGAVIGALL